MKIDKTVINARPDRCRATRPTDAAAAAGNLHTAAMLIQKVKVNISTDRNTDTTSVSVPGKIQIANVDCPTKSTHPDASEVLLQRQSRQLNMVTPLQIADSTEKCKVRNHTFTRKINIQEPSTFHEICETGTNKRWFRRKRKRQKPNLYPVATPAEVSDTSASPNNFHEVAHEH